MFPKSKPFRAYDGMRHHINALSGFIVRFISSALFFIFFRGQFPQIRAVSAPGLPGIVLP